MTIFLINLYAIDEEFGSERYKYLSKVTEPVSGRNKTSSVSLPAWTS